MYLSRYVDSFQWLKNKKLKLTNPFLALKYVQGIFADF